MCHDYAYILHAFTQDSSAIALFVVVIFFRIA